MFDWSTYADLADDLLDASPTEAELRSAISHAAFHAARDFLDWQGPLVARDGTAHHEVWWRMRHLDRSIAFNLRRLHRWRLDADYEDRYPGPLGKQARTSLITAKRLLREIALLK